MKKLLAMLNISILFAVGMYSNSAQAIVLTTCEVGATPLNTWYIVNKCTLVIEFHDDVPGVTDVQTTNVTYGDPYWSMPNWLNGGTRITGSDSTQDAINRYGTAPYIYMDALAVAYTSSTKYRSQPYGFSDPFLWAPIGVLGSWYYKQGGTWYLSPDVDPGDDSDEDNYCAGCGASTIFYPNTP